MSKNEIQVFEGDITTQDDSGDANDMAHRFLQEIVITKKSIGLKFLYLGKLLHTVRENGYYKQYADTYAEYIAMPEIGLKHSTAENLKRIYREFVVGWGADLDVLAAVGSSKLVALLEKTDIDEDSVDEWLSKAATLSHRDLMIETGSVSGDFNGIILAKIYSDDMGLILDITNAPQTIKIGSYRISKDGAVGVTKELAYMKGRMSDV